MSEMEVIRLQTGCKGEACRRVGVWAYGRDRGAHRLEGSRFGAWYRDLKTFSHGAVATKTRLKQAAPGNVSTCGSSIACTLLDPKK